MVIGAVGGAIVHMTFESNDGILISDIHRDRIFHSFAPDPETAFCLNAVFR